MPYRGKLGLKTIYTAFGWDDDISVEPRSTIIILHNLLNEYECIHRDQEEIYLAIESRRALTGRLPDYMI